MARAEVVGDVYTSRSFREQGLSQSPLGKAPYRGRNHTVHGKIQILTSFQRSQLKIFRLTARGIQRGNLYRLLPSLLDVRTQSSLELRSTYRM